MTSRDLHDWPAQQPPADFAERAVLAMLAAEARPGRARSKKRWPALLAAAVVFAGAGAWAAMGGWRPVPPAPVVAPMAPAPPPPPPATETAAPVQAPPAPLEAADGGAVTVRVRPRPSATASAEPAPVEPTPDAGRWIMVPSCTCSPFEGICSCVE